MRKRISKIEVTTIALLLPSILFWLAFQSFISDFGSSQEKELIKAFWTGMSEDEAPKDYFFEVRNGKRRVMEDV